jgi:hypothetical protein
MTEKQKTLTLLFVALFMSTLEAVIKVELNARCSISRRILRDRRGE